MHAKTYLNKKLRWDVNTIRIVKIFSKGASIVRRESRKGVLSLRMLPYGLKIRL